MITGLREIDRHWECYLGAAGAALLIALACGIRARAALVAGRAAE